jgi:hypothetical protein
MNQDQEFEKRNEDYIQKIKNYEKYFRTKNIGELEKERLDLKPKNIGKYLYNFFFKSEKFIKLSVLEKILSNKIKQKEQK